MSFVGQLSSSVLVNITQDDICNNTSYYGSITLQEVVVRRGGRGEETTVAPKSCISNEQGYSSPSIFLHAEDALPRKQANEIEPV